MRRFNLTAGLLLNLRPDAIGRPLREAKSTMDAAYLEKLVGAVIETSDAADVEVQDAAGDWRLLRIRAYRTSGGNIDGAIVAVLDINELKRSVLVAEEAARAATMQSEASALLASSLDYETTLESLARLSTAAFADWCAVDLVNDDGSIRHLTVSHANPVLRELALQFQQAAFSEPESAPGAPQALRLRESVLLSDIAEWKLSGAQPEARITQLIGALGVRSLISVPLIVRDKVLGTTTFSSSRRQYDSDDLRLAEDLSQRAAVAIDTAMLFREAESANRYKDAFLGTVAHELRTPLTSILGWVQLAQGHPEMHGEALSRVEESATLLRLFIEDLLDVARIREKKLRMDMAEIDMASIVRSALDITAPGAGRNQIRLHLALDPAPLRGDRGAAPAGRLEPAEQCDQVHAARRHDRRTPRAGRQRRALVGPRYRLRHQRRVRAARVRAVPAGGCDVPSPDGTRNRALDRRADRETPRRDGSRREPGRRPGLDVHRLPPPLRGDSGGKLASHQLGTPVRQVPPGQARGRGSGEKGAFMNVPVVTAHGCSSRVVSLMIRVT